jgi:hypothetical protein
LPKFLPPFPPEHTFIFTTVIGKGKKEEKELQKMKTKQRHQIESSLTRLHGDEYLKNIKENNFGEIQQNTIIMPQENPSKKRKKELINPYLTIKKTNVKKKSKIGI